MTMKTGEKNMSKGILTVVSGFSGAGKGTVMKRLLESRGNYALSISVTTREPREGEAEGREYFFRTKEEVEKMIREDQLLEYAKYVDHYYGTPRKYVEDRLAEGKDVILEIEIQGALQIKKKVPEAVLVFITPPSMAELERRLTERGTEVPEVIASRLARASVEAGSMDKYDYVLVNDKVEDCVETLRQLISSEHLRSQRNMDFIRKIQEESRIFKKGE